MFIKNFKKSVLHISIEKMLFFALNGYLCKLCQFQYNQDYICTNNYQTLEYIVRYYYSCDLHGRIRLKIA